MPTTFHIAICTAQVPFTYGGNEALVDGLRDALAARGHKVAVIALPYKWYPRPQIISSALAWRMIDITESDGRRVDLAICTKWPSYVVRHPCKVTWLVHQFRQVYDWFGTPLSDFTGSPEDGRIPRLVARIDRETLAQRRRIFTLSRNVAGRVRRFNGLEGTPLYPPIRQGLALEPGPYGDYVFALSRLDAAKRLDLLLEALALSPGVRAVIAGTGPDAEALRKRAARLGVSDRVEFAGFVSDEQASRYYTGARAVYFAPVDEDYGYGAVEALQAARPVITTDDSGGVLEFVEDGVSGYITPPESAAIARSIMRAMSNQEEAARLGAAGRDRVKGITW